ncbi:hypothetical protein D3C86_903520 [compost metagenome]
MSAPASAASLRPWAIVKSEPEPSARMTLTGRIETPGATPTMPPLWPAAPRIPATWVPWPLPSLKA